jgi:hypothetical protein
MALSPHLRNFLLKTAIKKTVCHTLGINELTFYITALGAEYVMGNQPTWKLINASNTLPQWELEISRVLNENYRQAKLPQLQQEQRERDEFWQQRDTKSEL